jgi:hypothetical protein
MSDYPDPNQLVYQSRVYGSINPGSLYMLMVQASSGNVNRYVYIRNSVQPHLSIGNARDVDSIYSAARPFESGSVAPPSNAPKLIVPIGTTPTDTGGLIFPPPNAPADVQDQFYKSKAYQDYIGARMASTAGPGRDDIFNNYVLNGVLSYEANNNIFGAIGYMREIAMYHKEVATSNVRQTLVRQGLDLTAHETTMLMGGIKVPVVRSPLDPSRLISLDRYLNPDDVEVIALRSAPVSGIPTLGILTLMTSGIGLITLPDQASSPTAFEMQNYRSLMAEEFDTLTRIFGERARSAATRTLFVFGSGNNAIAEKAFKKGHTAITLGTVIYFNQAPSAFRSARDIALLAHEFEHVLQNAKEGTLWTALNIGLEAFRFGVGGAYAYYTRDQSWAAETREAKALIVQDYVTYRETGTLPDPNSHGGYTISAVMLEKWAVGSGIYGK